MLCRIKELQMNLDFDSLELFNKKQVAFYQSYFQFYMPSLFLRVCSLMEVSNRIATAYHLNYLKIYIKENQNSFTYS